MKNSELAHSAVLTPDEYVVFSVNQYPALYASPSYESTKLKVLDYVFNVVVGDSLYGECMYLKVRAEDFSNAEKWFSCSEIAFGYVKVKEVVSCNRKITIGVGDCITVPSAEVEYTTGIAHWSFMKCKEFKTPDPCFKEEYSLVWCQDGKFLEFGSAWIEAAIHYYLWCLSYFQDPVRYSSYHYAFPGNNEAENLKRVRFYQESLSPEKYPTNEDISVACGCQFVGDRSNAEDVAAFASRRWNLERERIITFVEKTLDYLSSKGGA